MSLAFLDIAKSFGERDVLRGATWNIPSGSIGVILGANGTGKSTLLRILASLVKPERGTVQVAGASTEVGRRRALGFVGHMPPLTAALSVADNVRFRAKVLGLTPNAEALERWLAPYDLQPMREQAVRSLSRGQAQRVALATAELGEAPVMLLDEPFTGLDVEHSERLVARLTAWRGAGRTILLTTHDVALGLRMADHVAVLTAGKVFEVPEAQRETKTVEQVLGSERERLASRQSRNSGSG